MSTASLEHTTAEVQTEHYIEKEEKQEDYEIKKPKNIFFDHFFLYYSASCSITSLMSFLPNFVYALSDKTNSVIGIYGILRSVNVIGVFLWSYIGDRKGTHAQLLPFLLSMFVGSYAILLITDPSYRTKTLLFAFLALGNLFESGVVPITDSIVLNALLRDVGENASLGRVRIGALLGAATIGIITTNTHKLLKIDMFSITIYYAAAFCTLFVSILVVRGFLTKTEDVHARVSVLWIEYINVLKNPTLIAVLMAILSVGLTKTPLILYLNLYLVECAGETMVRVAFLILVRSIIEAAIVSYSAKLVRRFGVAKMLLAGQLTGTIRVLFFGLYGMRRAPFGVLAAAESLKGINSAVTTALLIELAKLYPVRNNTSFIQGVFYTMHYGFAYVFTGIIALLVVKSTEDLPLLFLISGMVGIFGIAATVCVLASRRYLTY